MATNSSEPGKGHFQRIENFMESFLEHDLMVMHVETRDTVMLNPSAAVLWEALKWPQTLDDLTDLLLEAHPEQPRKTFKSQVQKVLKTLGSRGLIVRAITP